MNKNITALGLAILLATSAMMGSGCSKVEKKETKEYSILDEIIKEKESEESTATTSPYDERDTYVDDLREQYVEDEPVVRLSQEIKKTGEEAYKECPKAIDFFCEYMKVEKKDLELGYVFKTEEYNNLEICYEIKVSEDAEKSGKYIFAVGKGKEEVITMAKYVPDEVREEKDIEKWEEADLYEYLYDVEKIVEDTNEFVKPQVEVGNEYKYKEKLSDSNMIWGAYDGYVNEDDEFMVSYYEDFTHWNQGVYKDGYWKTKKLKSIKFGSAYECFTGKDDILWFYDEDLLDVRDKNKRVICQIKMNKWKKQNGIKKKATVEISPLPENKAIFTINGKESYRVNIRSGKIEMKYDTALEGEYYGDYICHYYPYCRSRQSQGQFQLHYRFSLLPTNQSMSNSC